MNTRISILFISVLALNFTFISSQTCANEDKTEICITLSCNADQMKITIEKIKEDTALKFVTIGNYEEQDCTISLDVSKTEKDMKYTSPCITSDVTVSTQITYKADIWVKQNENIIMVNDLGLAASCIKPLSGFLTNIETNSIKTSQKALSEGETAEEVKVEDVIPTELNLEIKDAVPSGGTDTNTDASADPPPKNLGDEITIEFKLSDKAKEQNFADISIKSLTVSAANGKSTIPLVSEDCALTSDQAKSLIKTYQSPHVNDADGNPYPAGERKLITLAVSMEAASQMVYEGTVALWKMVPVANCAARRKREINHHAYMEEIVPFRTNIRNKRQSPDPADTEGAVVVPFQKTMDVQTSDATSTSSGGTSGGSDGGTDSSTGCDENQNIFYLQLIVALVTVNGMNLITSLYFGLVMASLN